MHFDVEEKGDRDVAPPRPSLPRREQQQRQPRDQHADENAAMDQRQRIVGEARPAKQLEQRAAEHEREVGRLLLAAGLSGCHGRVALAIDVAANRGYGLTVTAALNWNCRRVSAGSFKCS